MHKILANTSFLGKHLLYLPECHSTNDVAMQKYKNKEANEGFIIITDRQTAGRGQRGSQWESEPHKNLTFSLVLTPRFLAPLEQFGLNMAVVSGIREAIGSVVSGTYVKWPNDIVHDTHTKIGGVLIENIISYNAVEASIVGIGLNINQKKFTHPQAASLATLTGKNFDKETVLTSIIQHIEKYYFLLKEGNSAALTGLYLSHLYRRGELSSFDDGEKFSGTIKGITPEGKLLIEKQHGAVMEYGFKEVRFL